MQDYEYLIHLIYCAVNETVPDEKPEEVSFKKVFLLGKAHEVANIAFLSVERLKQKPEPALYNEWKIYYYFSVERDSRQTEEREAVVSAMHDNGIRTLEAQGTVTKTLYPSPELRMMSDIDFIIDFDKLGEAMEIMRSLGYEVSQKQPVEFDAVKDGRLVEFHTVFFTDSMYNRKERYSSALNEPFSHAEPSDGDALSYYLNDTYFYLFSVLHIIKHFETAGCGIRRVLDLYYLKKAFCDKYDKAVFDSVIDSGGFSDSCEKLFAVEEMWFEGAEPEIDLSEAVSDIVRSGNHGTSGIFTRNNVRKDEREGIRFPRLKRIFGFIFPDREYILINYHEFEERGYSTFKCRMLRILDKLRKMNFSHAVAHIKEILKSR
ncbi:MAG: nucleotidyltransferase family protein [Eubacterium sp.]|nr:nucleotidyltransferase family protein [Eubacterium sp.]